MRLHHAFLCGFAATSVAGLAQPLQAPATREIVLTALPRGKAAPPALDASNLTIRQGNANLMLASVQRANGDHARMDLWILLDRGAAQSLLPALPELRNFVSELPPTTRVGVGIMQDGGLQTLAGLDVPRDQAVAALQPPANGLSQSPFESIAPLLAAWAPEPGVRHEIIAFTEAQTPVYQDVGDNPIIRKLLPVYQGAGVVFYGIFVKPPQNGPTTKQQQAAGGFTPVTTAKGPGAKPTSTNSNAPADAGLTAGVSPQAMGQTNLTNVARATGGQAYFGNGLAPETVKGYLDDIRMRMENQYVVAYTVPQALKPGADAIKVSTSANGLALTTQTAIVP